MVGGPPVIDDGDSLTTAGISIGASTSTGGSRPFRRGRVTSAPGAPSTGTSTDADASRSEGISIIDNRSGGRRELSVL
jgi:hypothetical protein